MLPGDHFILQVYICLSKGFPETSNKNIETIAQ